MPSKLEALRNIALATILTTSGGIAFRSHQIDAASPQSIELQNSLPVLLDYRVNGFEKSVDMARLVLAPIGENTIKGTEFLLSPNGLSNVEYKTQIKNGQGNFLVPENGFAIIQGKHFNIEVGEMSIQLGTQQLGAVSDKPNYLVAIKGFSQNVEEQSVSGMGRFGVLKDGRSRILHITNADEGAMAERLRGDDGNEFLSEEIVTELIDGKNTGLVLVSLEEKAIIILVHDGKQNTWELGYDNFKKDQTPKTPPPAGEQKPRPANIKGKP